MPLVSVIIPVYNAGELVRTAIASVLAQRFADFEVVVVDDGSTDASAAICRSVEDRRIRLLKQANNGPASARNAGIRASSGRFVALLDADDLWLADKLERHVQHLEENPTVGVSFSHSRLISAGGRPTGQLQAPAAGTCTAESLFLENPIGNASSPVLRREALDAIAFPGVGHRSTSYFDESLPPVDDLDCWWRIAFTTPWTVACLPEVLTFYRQHPASLSSQPDRMAVSWEKAIDKARGYAPDAVARLERPARARFLRYLAGRAVAAGDGRAACRLLREAVHADPGLLRTHHRATMMTLAAALGLRFLPRPVYRMGERSVKRVMGHPA